MSTLIEVVSQGSINNALTGVKRPLQGNPTSVPKNLPAFRGVPNTPGNAVKAPKLNPGNRPDRGTNVLTPVARVTPLTSIAINMGRLSPGDIAFIRRTPGGYLKANFGGSYCGQSSGDAHMTDMVGIDGVNRFLSGTINGARAWNIGNNVIDTGATPIDDATNLFGFDPASSKPYLSCLREYRLDGVVLSNEEPYSFNPTEGRDATVFNIGIKGPAPVNNGFLVYDTHAATELYSRGKDPTAYGENMRIGSERAAGTWHGKVGYDFVAAYTSVYTEYPLQMFDRDVRVLDNVYLLLRKFNIEDDVVAPRVRALMLNTVTKAKGVEVVGGVERVKYVTGAEFTTEAAARAAVVAGLVIKNADGTDMTDKSKGKLRKMVFFQYMPCSSRAFVKYHETLKLVDESLSAPDKVTFGSLLYSKDEPSKRTRIGKRDNYARQGMLDGLLNARRKAYIDNEIYKNEKGEHDAVRFLDILMCAGAWKVGKVIDTRSARATPYANGPTNASYRMTVVMDVEWLPRNKSVFFDPSEYAIVDDAIARKTMQNIVNQIGQNLRRPPVFWATPGRAYSQRKSQERGVLSSMRGHTLSERELYEAPLIVQNKPLNTASGSAPGGTGPTLASVQGTSRNANLEASKANNDIQAAGAFDGVDGPTATGYQQAAQAAYELADAANKVVQGNGVDVATAASEFEKVEAIQKALEILSQLAKSPKPAVDPSPESVARNTAMNAVVEWVKDPLNADKKDATEQSIDDYAAAVAGFTTNASARPSSILDPMQRHLAYMTMMQQTSARARAHANAARSATSAPLTAAAATATSTSAAAAAKPPPPKPAASANTTKKPAGKPVTASAASASTAAPAKATLPRPAATTAAPRGVDPVPLSPVSCVASSAAAASVARADAPTAQMSCTAAPASTAAAAATSAPRAAGSSLVNSTIAASRKAAMAPEAAAAAPKAPEPAPAASAPRSQGVVDSVFDTIFGASAAPPSRPLASPSSPTPSSGSETGPRAFSRRNR